MDENPSLFTILGDLLLRQQDLQFLIQLLSTGISHELEITARYPLKSSHAYELLGSLLQAPCAQ